MNKKITTFALSTALFALAGNGVQAQMLPFGQTPMVSILQANAQQSPQFSINSWTSNSFTSEALITDVPELEEWKDKTITSVKMAKGFASFRNAGEHTFTFTYKGGKNKLIIVAVAAKDLAGNLVDLDMHKGETGKHSEKNTYKLDIPEPGLYELTYFVANLTNEPINSNGVISVSPDIHPGIARFDLPLDSDAQLTQWVASSETKEPNNIELGNSTYEEPWAEEYWMNVENNPKQVQDLGFQTANVKQLLRPIYLSKSGEITANYKYVGQGKSGNKALHPVGVDLLDASGSVVASDYHKGIAGHRVENTEYKFAVDKGGNYTLRFLCENKSEIIASVGKIQVSAQLGNDIWHLAKNDFYNINVDKNATKGTDRVIRNISITQYNNSKLTINNQPQNKVYVDYTNNQEKSIYVIPGEKVKFDVDWQGSWMHSYLYLDRNQNNKFDVTQIEDEELLLSTYYNDKKKTDAGVENESNRWPGTLKFSTPFTAPTKPGEYRLRYKIDWNSVDPGGNTENNNTITGNRGNIVDFTLIVMETKGLPNEYMKGLKHTLKVHECTNGNYATMMLPYPVKLHDELYAYKLKEAPSTGTLNFELIDNKYIPANTPVFITAKQAGDYECEAFQNANDPIETNLDGTTESLPAAKRDTNYKYYVLVKDENGKAVFRVIKQYDINANRCFLKIPVNSSATAIQFELPSVTDPTAVSKVALEDKAETGATYNLAGQRIDAASAKGVVIRNGKKVVLP